MEFTQKFLKNNVVKLEIRMHEKSPLRFPFSFANILVKERNFRGG
jgi:hypothetical protein